SSIILIIVVNVSHDRCKELKKFAIPLALIGTIFSLLNPLLVSRGSHILFYLGDRQITLEAIVFGVVMAFMVVSVIMLFISFNIILNGSKFLYIFSKFLPRIAFLFMLTILFVPLLKDL